ncbi:TPA: hypothetical protein DEO28_01525 [Candidatus Dependentiae bacterium]|nr:MAG: hypothetical protein UR14_C0003G0152 [candidate division TM6 bacterium GW2011_GWE2_31_21]KKP53684.1 MAG: hypothetical protein UR43_C0003G0005 [candidate division TM6 bacterium GW2011_GWF2_33_332]HBS48564.1 hypothetical protein [Candidatus Dependentiae bacterium]HBZ73179.1 hypothetical protein [Candidatus Dependentiae bacterium]
MKKIFKIIFLFLTFNIIQANCSVLKDAEHGVTKAYKEGKSIWSWINKNVHYYDFREFDQTKRDLIYKQIQECIELSLKKNQLDILTSDTQGKTFNFCLEAVQKEVAACDCTKKENKKIKNNNKNIPLQDKKLNWKFQEEGRIKEWRNCSFKYAAANCFDLKMKLGEVITKEFVEANFSKYPIFKDAFYQLSEMEACRKFFKKQNKYFDANYSAEGKLILLALNFLDEYQTFFNMEFFVACERLKERIFIAKDMLKHIDRLFEQRFDISKETKNVLSLNHLNASDFEYSRGNGLDIRLSLEFVDIVNRVCPVLDLFPQNYQANIAAKIALQVLKEGKNFKEKGLYDIAFACSDLSFAFAIMAESFAYQTFNGFDFETQKIKKMNFPKITKQKSEDTFREKFLSGAFKIVAIYTLEIRGLISMDEGLTQIFETQMKRSLEYFQKNNINPDLAVLEYIWNYGDLVENLKLEELMQNFYIKSNKEEMIFITPLSNVIREIENLLNSKK